MAVARRSRAPRLVPMLALLVAQGCSTASMTRAGAAAPGPAIAVDQLGYLPDGAKWAAVRPAAGVAAPLTFAVRDEAGGAVVYRGALTSPRDWSPAGQAWQLADFTGLRMPGRYRLQVDGQPDSPAFAVERQAYAALNAAAIKAYYFNRAGIELGPEYAGPYARAAGHPDDRVLVHASAAGPGRPEGSVIASPKGWYDAGDYNKYIVNSAISVYTLLAAYEQFPGFFRHQAVHIPESGNGMPDLVDEVLWNVDWMLTMQDPADGGVYHKLTNRKFDGSVMPAGATTPRYVVQKTTAAALDFAASMAMASRVMRAFETERPGLSERLLKAARRAWSWADAHPHEVYRQPPDIVTGEYGDSQLDDEFAWAAAELYISTRDDHYYALVQRDGAALDVPAWGQVRTLGWISLAQHRNELTTAADPALIERRLQQLADPLVARWAASPFRLAMQDRDFTWGSNSVALNQAFVMLQAYRLSGRRPLLDAAQSALDYVLGRNPVGQSYVTGVGTTSPRHPHHRPSQADGVAAPVPGFMVAGSNPGQQDRRHCPVPYPSSAPALSYLDVDCAYASNEVAINWNAPLVYVSAALQVLTGPEEPADMARTLTLPRSAQAYGRVQHAPLPLRPGEVVLTFDDGPNPASTPAVLKALADGRVRATFFMNGEPLARAPELARQVRAQGHSVGMHGFEHAHFGQYSPERQLGDLRAMEDAFTRVFGDQAPAYRFPFLEETDPLRQALADQKVTVMSVDVGIDDWLPDQSPEILAQRLLERLHATDGGIVLMHDAQPQTAAALPLLLRALREHGYRVVHLEWADR